MASGVLECVAQTAMMGGQRTAIMGGQRTAIMGEQRTAPGKIEDMCGVEACQESQDGVDPAPPFRSPY
jgi:hypothetical protein